MNRWNPSNSSFLQDVTDAMTLLHAEAEAEGVEVSREEDIRSNKILQKMPCQIGSD